jgi:hypothetical protein
MAEFISGIAGEIRAATASEQWDLAGYTEARAQDLVRNAFGQILDAPSEMVKFTFVVGGGKLVRAKYSDDLIKWFTNALRDVGYEVDTSAALDFSSAGTFKQQHDTGQNLKVVVVFPKLTCAMQKSADGNSGPVEVVVDVTSKEYIINACEFSTFCEIATTKTESWTQKKRLLTIIQEGRQTFEALEVSDEIGLTRQQEGR